MMNSLIALPFAGVGVPASSASAAASPAANAVLDMVGVVWKSASLTSPYLVLDAGSTQATDTLAAMWTNLRSTDTIRWRAYDSQANAVAGGTTGLVAGSDTGALSAWLGTELRTSSAAKQLIVFDTPVSARFWRLDFAAAGHPDGYVRVSRVLLAKRVLLAIGQKSAEVYPVDTGLKDTSDYGEEFADARRVTFGTKLPYAFANQDEMTQQLWPLAMAAGTTARRVLFCWDRTIAQASDFLGYGLMASVSRMESDVYDIWEATIDCVSLAA